MKNNTKLIMETWRRFLKEGPDDDIKVFYGDEYDPNQEENSIDEPLSGEADFDSNVPVSDDDIGDPAMIGRDSSAPMLGASDDDDMMYDTDDSEYVTDDDSLNPNIAYDSGSFDDSLDRMP